MAPETLRFEVADGVGTVTLHRPDKLNALNGAMLEELLTALEQADADDAVRVLIVTGAGRAFCAGADLSGGGGTFDRSARAGEREAHGRGATSGPHRDGGGRVTLRIFDMKKPVIAAINGPAVGFGITMTLPMAWFLPRLVGISRAAEWVYSGRVFSADEALQGGLVSRVVPPEQLLPVAREPALEIARNASAVSVALSRQLMWRSLGADHPMEAHRLDSKCMEWTGRSADAYEGVTAFLEKRPARFTLKASTDLPPFYPWWSERPFEP